MYMQEFQLGCLLLNLIMSPTHIYHGLDEVFTIQTEHPDSANYEVFL